MLGLRRIHFFKGVTKLLLCSAPLPSRLDDEPDEPDGFLLPVATDIRGKRETTLDPLRRCRTLKVDICGVISNGDVVSTVGPCLARPTWPLLSSREGTAKRRVKVAWGRAISGS